MKIIHTADWHLGNTIYEYDRSYEHKCFFNNLKSIIEKESVDALLVCGDIFHNYMPSNVAENIFGEFLVEFRKTFPKLQIVIIAGNHDGGLKIDTTGKYCSLDPRIHIIGTIPYKTDSDQIDYEKMTIPLFDQNDAICAYVLAIPYIRPSYLHWIAYRLYILKLLIILKKLIRIHYLLLQWGTLQFKVLANLKIITIY